MAARRPTGEQESQTFYFDHAQVTETTTLKLIKLSNRYPFRIDTVYYLNPTGLATHVDDWFVIALKNGSTVISDWSTDTGEEGTIAADTFVTLTNSVTDADLVVAAAGTLTLLLTEGGSATLPAGRIVIHGRYA
jgi:hypothetical protein